MVNTVWSTTDKTNVTLSGGNLIATSTSTSAGVRTPDRQISGKYYWEVTSTSVAGAGTLVGALTSGTPLSPQNSTYAAALTHSGALVVNGATIIGTFGTVANGTVICFALDIGNRLFWVRLGAAGNWNNAAGNNPATGSGGVSLAALGVAAFYPGIIYGGSGDQLTANFGDSAFSGAVPSGFTSGFPVGTPPLLAVNTQTAVEQWSSPNPQSWATQVALEQWGLTGTVATRATATQVALEQWVSLVARPPVELAGNLGGISSYGKRSYGVKHYSRVDAFEPLLSAALTVSIGRGLAGDLAPVVGFAGSLGVVQGVSGNFAPVVTFAADLVVIGFVDFVGGIVPQVGLGGSLAVDVSLTALEGGLTPIVALGASSFVSGPLWATSEPCPTPPWEDSELCPPPAWMLSEPCGPVAWAPTRLCNG